MSQRCSEHECLDLGVRLRARRTALALTREALAASAQLTPSRLSAVERGAALISAIELRRLAAALKAPISTFLPDLAPGPGEPVLIAYDALARSDDGATLAEAFVRIRTPRLRRHLVQLACELAAQDAPAS